MIASGHLKCQRPELGRRAGPTATQEEGGPQVCAGLQAYRPSIMGAREGLGWEPPLRPHLEQPARRNREARSRLLRCSAPSAVAMGTGAAREPRGGGSDTLRSPSCAAGGRGAAGNCGRMPRPRVTPSLPACCRVARPCCHRVSSRGCLSCAAATALFLKPATFHLGTRTLRSVLR